MSNEDLKPRGLRPCGKCSGKYLPPGESITREQVNEWCEQQGMVVVPREPNHKMLIILFDQWESEGRMTMTDNYKAMIKAAQESSNEQTY
jgi:hypothetical protein